MIYASKVVSPENENHKRNNNPVLDNDAVTVIELERACLSRKCANKKIDSIMLQPTRRVSSTQLPKPAKGYLIEWMMELLSDYIKKIIHSQRLRGVPANMTPSLPKRMNSTNELQEVIAFPKSNAPGSSGTESDDVEIEEQIMEELRQYVTDISALYGENPFHNFEHACQVTSSVDKLLQGIVKPTALNFAGSGDNNACCASLVSDPITSFAIIFSAFIHDVDHRGVSNAQLHNEDPELSARYLGKSIAEQNSLDIAWDVLMSGDFENLRHCLFTSEQEMDSFRQLLVNIVLATDIFDKELNEWRKMRWDRIIAENSNNTEQTEKESKNSSRISPISSSSSDLQATVVIEQLIQASDVSHTMQNWYIYRKWNQRLFKEMRLAYCQGRMKVDPATFWYQGELDFFDKYIIPMVQKLKHCNVLEENICDGFLKNATRNRAKWADNGHKVVEDMVKELAAEFQKIDCCNCAA